MCLGYLHPIWQIEAFSVSVGQFKSGAAHLFCGVPQGSVLGLALFALYLLALVELLITLMASSVISLLMTSRYTVCLLLTKFTNFPSWLAAWNLVKNVCPTTYFS